MWKVQFFLERQTLWNWKDEEEGEKFIFSPLKRRDNLEEGLRFLALFATRNLLGLCTLSNIGYLLHGNRLKREILIDEMKFFLCRNSTKIHLFNERSEFNKWILTPFWLVLTPFDSFWLLLSQLLFWLILSHFDWHCLILLILSHLD